MDRCEFCVKRGSCSGLKQFTCESNDYVCYEQDKNAVEQAMKELSKTYYVAGMRSGKVLVEKRGKGKIKAKFKQIISRLIDGKMYYEILYIDEKGNSTIGFGSYNIGYVVRWLNECFEL